MPQPTIERRSLVRGVGWAAPVVLASAAVPAYAASKVCSYSIPFVSKGFNNATTQTFTAVGTNPSQTKTIRFTSTSAAGTVHSQYIDGANQNFNMTTSGSGINGGSPTDRLFKDFAPVSAPGALVLNQRGTNVDQGYPPSQRVHLDFLDAQGKPISVSDLEIKIFDISSVRSKTTTRATYWDAVYFNQAPSRIVSETPEDGGTGRGTSSSPFHRINEHFATKSGRVISDKFYWDTISTKGLDLTYTQVNGRAGWQFISISGVTFKADC